MECRERQERRVWAYSKGRKGLCKEGCIGYKNTWACSEKDEIDSVPSRLGRLYLGKTILTKRAHKAQVKIFTVPVTHCFWRIKGKCG